MDMGNDFWPWLIRTAIDKFLLTAAGAGIAYFAARALERYRRRQSTALELAKLRVNALRDIIKAGSHFLALMAVANGIARSPQASSIPEGLLRPEDFMSATRELFLAMGNLSLVQVDLQGPLKTFYDSVMASAQLMGEGKGPESMPPELVKRTKDAWQVVVRYIPELPANA